MSYHPEINHIQMDCGHLSFIADSNIILLRIEDNYYMEQADSLSVKKNLRILAAPKKCPVYLLVDIRQIKGASAAGRKVFAAKEEPLAEVCALWVKSPLSKLLGNFLLGINKPIFPAAVFKEKEKALAWIEQQIKE